MPPGIFCGIIGGPPCQWASSAMGLNGRNGIKNKPLDLIPEFVRIVNEAAPSWVIMENVMAAKKSAAIPKEGVPTKLVDWDCGGMTMRRRYFWVWPDRLILMPSKRPGKGEYTVLATSWKTRSGFRDKFKTIKNGYRRGMHEYITTKKAAELQGFPELLPMLEDLPRRYAVPLLGNGVPKAMGLYIARATKYLMEKS